MKNYTTPEVKIITLTTADVISASSLVSCDGVATVGWGDFKVDNNSGFDF